MRRAAIEKGGTVGETTASKQNNCFGAVVNTGSSWSQNMGVGVCAQIIEVSCKNPGAPVQLCQPGTLICPYVCV